MELTSQKREVKLHGTYGFPVYVGRKLISAYPTGSLALARRGGIYPGGCRAYGVPSQ